VWVIDANYPLDPRLARTLTHALSIGTFAPQQAQPGQDHRLTSTGFPGDHSEPRTKVHLRSLDHTKISDGDGLNHRAPRHPCTGRENFATRRSVKGANRNRANRTG